MDYKFYLNKGIVETNNNNFEEALNSICKAEELNSKDPLIYFSKAIVYHNIDKLYEAYENYTKAINLNPRMIDAYFNRAQVLLAYKDNDEIKLKKALKDLEKSIDLDKKFIDAMYSAATVKKKLKDYKGAIKLLDKILEIEPQAIYSKALKKLIQEKYL